MFGSKSGSVSISIHSLRVEGDIFTYPPRNILRHFNPLPPCGGRHIYLTSSKYSSAFQSTPSVWRETRVISRLPFWYPNFNPLPPCGGRRKRNKASRGSAEFQSTPSVWRETSFDKTKIRSAFISIHSLRVEGDFVSTVKLHRQSISIHSLRVEGDIVVFCQFDSENISIHSLRVEGDPQILLLHLLQGYFNPLPPCGGRRNRRPRKR